MTSGIGVKGKELDKPDRRLLAPSTNNKGDRTEGMHYVSDCELDSDGEEGWAAQAQMPRYPFEGILPRSRHRDCSLYRNTQRWTKEFRVANRNESK